MQNKLFRYKKALLAVLLLLASYLPIFADVFVPIELFRNAR
jgi:hypothetical protein